MAKQNLSTMTTVSFIVMLLLICSTVASATTLGKVVDLKTDASTTYVKINVCGERNVWFINHANLNVGETIQLSEGFEMIPGVFSPGTHEPVAQTLYQAVVGTDFDQLLAENTVDRTMVRCLIKAGANPNVTTENGNTPLTVAASSYGDKEMVRFLLNHGADVNMKDSNSGLTALWEAVDDGESENARLLIAAGADPNIVNPETGKNLFWTTAEKILKNRGDKELLDLLLLLIESGTDIHKKWKGITPLLFAVGTNNSVLVKPILDKDPDVNAQDHKYGMTALMIASSAGKPDIVRLLLKHGANTGLKNKKGQTALDLARDRGEQKIIGILKEAS